ncbi:translation initiation factor IF-6 [Candidatus Micrarchaeota archaeon]|nr:translation initiation factor IF-6 [Candidatus Micrarchaeota archaeon]
MIDKLCAYFGNPWIGMFIKTNDETTFVPLDTPDKLVKKISENLKTNVVRVSISDSNLLGIYIAMNSNGVVLPNVATAAEISAVKETGLNVYISKDKNNALGNNLLLNDKGALINSNISKEEIKNIQDTLGIEIFEGKIANYSTVGSACIANNDGFLAHFNTSESELDDIKKKLKINGLKGSINMGVGFISYGVIHNKNGYLAGELSSGFELGRVEEALGYIK